jgi:hypothetical protein
MPRKRKYTGHQNPDAHRANIERTRSGAAGKHQDARYRRARTRAAARAQAKRDFLSPIA